MGCITWPHSVTPRSPQYVVTEIRHCLLNDWWLESAWYHLQTGVLGVGEGVVTVQTERAHTCHLGPSLRQTTQSILVVTPRFTKQYRCLL